MKYLYSCFKIHSISYMKNLYILLLTVFSMVRLTMQDSNFYLFVFPKHISLRPLWFVKGGKKFFLFYLECIPNQNKTPMHILFCRVPTFVPLYSKKIWEEIKEKGKFSENFFFPPFINVDVCFRCLRRLHIIQL